MFPLIQSPCPYKGDPAAIITAGNCRLCKREVHDITDWAEEERRAFLSACEGEVCVSYRAGARTAIAAAALAAGAVMTSMPAAAQDAQPAAQEEPQDEELMYIIVGGLRQPAKADWRDGSEQAQKAHKPAKRAMPVVYEDTPGKQAGGAKPSGA